MILYFSKIFHKHSFITLNRNKQSLNVFTTMNFYNCSYNFIDKNYGQILKFKLFMKNFVGKIY